MFNVDYNVPFNVLYSLDAYNICIYSPFHIIYNAVYNSQGCLVHILFMFMKDITWYNFKKY